MRMRALAMLSERVASPVEIAEELGESLGTVSYHVRILRELDCIELVGTTPVRGAVEHHYRAIERPYFTDPAWSRLPGPARRSISSSTLAQIWRAVSAAIDSKTFDSRENRHLSWTNLVLDEQGWDEVAELLSDAIDQALEIQAESAGRMTGGDSAEEVPMSKLVLMHFEGSPSAKKASKRGGGRAKKRK
ncbi:MAG: helix-turn-helix domain-containing protein [Thermoleophilaceae bacterium]